MLKKTLKSLPFQLVLCLVFAFALGDQLSETHVKFIYTISCVLKEIIMSILPIMIFSYIFAAILSLEKNAPILILVIVSLVVISNALVSFTSFGVAKAILPFMTIEQINNLGNVQEVKAYFSLGIPKIISSDKAMLSGFILGIVFCFFRIQAVSNIATNLQQGVNIFLKKIFVPLLPLYVLGFILKMHYEGSLSILFKSYAQIFILICVSLVSYLSFMYYAANKFSWAKFKYSMKQMAAPGLIGFSTISSAVSMPLTIIATENNIKDKPFARLVIPATVNIHMIGHGISIPITSLTILILSGHPLPSLEVFALFVMYFCLAKFSASAVPGGGIIVILPILQSQLGFTPEMCGIIVMLDILQDAVLTSANVMGNGALAIISYKICKFFGLTDKAEEPKHKEVFEVA